MIGSLLAGWTIAVALQDRPKAELTVAGRGVIEWELMVAEAPLTCAHISGLIERGFYNGILFHRRVAGFVIQAGDPTSRDWTPEEAKAKTPDKYGGTPGLGEKVSGKSVKFEKNSLSHAPGTVGIALESPGDNSGDSQFFINLADNKRLDGKYVVFARVTRGMDVVMSVRRGDLISRARMLQ